jgi:hypothetical protein
MRVFPELSARFVKARQSLVLAAAVAVAALGACNDAASGNPDGSLPGVDGATEPDLGANAPDAPRAETAGSDGGGIADSCSPNPCTSVGREVCVATPGVGAGYQCDCNEGLEDRGGACVATTCDGLVATTGLTVVDETPLATVANPVREGFDPLLAGDRARVQIHWSMSGEAGSALVQVDADHFVIDPATVRVDGALVTPTVRAVGRIDVPVSAASGLVELSGLVPEAGPGLLAIEARVATPEGCVVQGSGSGARIQLTGSLNPKYNTCNDISDLRALQISTGVPDKNTQIYADRNGAFSEIGDAYKILTQMTLCLQRPEGYTVSLAGSADGTRPWTIDNFLLIERFDRDPTLSGASRLEAWVTTSHSAVAPARFADESAIKVLSHASLPGDYTGSRTPSPFTFPAGTVQLSRVMPPGEKVWLRLTGLDTGVAGHLSRLFIHVAPPEVFVPECRTLRDCPRDDSRDGSNTEPRSGCLEGSCTAVPCDAGNPCTVGTRCEKGFCTESCGNDNNCPAGQVCAAGGVCTLLGPGRCRTFNDCATGEVCFFGRCQAGCFHPVNQNPTYGDNHSQYSLCRTQPGACPRCGDASSRCWNNYCRDCEIDAHCPNGQACRAYRCVAE